MAKKKTTRKPRKQNKIQSVKGMSDILPKDQKYWDAFIKVASSLAETFGFQKIDVPILEDVNLFRRGVGKGTDIVVKEMFELETKGGDNLALRPEPTAGIVRSYIEHGMRSLPKPVKLYFSGPVFRYERPQKGRRRQFHQFDVEVLGSRQAVSDAQVIALGWQILDKLDLSSNVVVQLNSIGCLECRPEYIELLKDYYKGKSRHLCADCKVRLKINPLRVLDCKTEKCSRLSSGAPNSVDYLCGECKDHFKELLEFMDELDIPYELNHLLVRGFDYYTKTVFEYTDKDDPKFAYGGGGRYDGLVQLLGGKPTGAVGFGLGMERIVDILKEKKKDKIPSRYRKPQVYLAQLGEFGKRKAFKVFIDLLLSGITTHESFSRNSLKSQLTRANKLGVKFLLIIGQKEVLDDTVIVRDMGSGVQEVLPLSEVVEFLKKFL
jgi:histidyl-tRNA synthetase